MWQKSALRPYKLDIQGDTYFVANQNATGFESRVPG
jgi:hypothetical protein